MYKIIASSSSIGIFCFVMQLVGKKKVKLKYMQDTAPCAPFLCYEKNGCCRADKSHN
jgi:hypothetical protein